MIQLVILLILSIVAVASIAVWQLWRYMRWYRTASCRIDTSNPVIVMLDYYQGSSELASRIKKTHELYRQLLMQGKNPYIVLTVGQLKGMSSTIAHLDRNQLVTIGVPSGQIFIYLGKNGKGAADTFEEVRLACEYIRNFSSKLSLGTVHIVTNPLQAFQAFMICVREGIIPSLETVPLQGASDIYVAGKLFQCVLMFFTPRGIMNPLLAAQRCWRRYVSNAI